MTYDIGQIIGKYIELRDRKAQLSKKHEEELAPFSEAMRNIENFLQHQMNELHVDQLKAETGTAFKTTTASCTMQDKEQFTAFVFQPAVENIVNYLNNSGYPLRDVDIMSLGNILRDMPRWGVVDLRAGKKGIQEYIEQHQQAVPGVSVNTIATVQIRRA